MPVLTKCVLCSRQDTHREACVDCTENLRRMLTDLPEFYALAAAGYADTTRGGKGSAASIGINVSALDGRTPRDAIWKLEAWERDWRETLCTFGNHDHADIDQRKRKAARWADAESPDFTGVNLCGVVNFLTIHLDTAATEHPAINEFAAELRTIHTEARNHAGEGEGDVTKVECPADIERHGEIQRCGALLTLTGEHANCPRCGTDWDRPRLMLVARSVGADVYAPIGVLAEHVGKSKRTIQRWYEAGLIRRKGKSYHHGDIVAVIESQQDESEVASM